MLRRNSVPAGVICSLLGLLLIAGCKDKPAPAPAPAPSAAPAAPPKPVQQRTSSTVSLPPPPVTQFDFSNKKDPFKPFVAIKAAPIPSAEKRKTALPIHSFDVSQFRLIGIITGGKENQAMVVDPNGKGYVLKVGMTVGKNDGKVVSISNGGVHVVEQFRDDNGKLRKENIHITLPRKQ